MKRTDFDEVKNKMVANLIIIPWKIDFILSLRKPLKERFLTGDKYEAYAIKKGTDEAHKAKWLINYIYKMAEQIDCSMQSIYDNLGLTKQNITECLRCKDDSFFVIKMHLISQELLWRYLNLKLGRLPKMHENWHYSQILDLAEAFDEIPDKIINYLDKLNGLRNRIAHKPKEFMFDKVKSSYKKSIYNKEKPVLFGLCSHPDTDDEICEDWACLFYVMLVVMGNILSKKGGCKFYDTDGKLLHVTNSPSGFDVR